ncbi:MAG: universal stress protein [Pseudomonadales bacterium]
MELNTIMAVIDPTQEDQPAFGRGLFSAKLTGASLHLYACINESYGEDDQETAISAMRKNLQSLCDTASDAGVQCVLEIDWAADWRKQIVKASVRIKADMLIKHAIDHSSTDRELRETADWTILRSVSCPVLIIKNHTRWEKRRILAAIDVNAADDKHQKLNKQIVEFTRGLADTYDSTAHFVNAFYDKNHEPDTNALSELCGVDQQQIHVVRDTAAEAISKTANAIEADLIIIGTVARNGIKARFLGNTSERLLDHTHSDLLVIH